jgi:hypothetical protein
MKYLNNLIFKNPNGSNCDCNVFNDFTFDLIKQHFYKLIISN